MPGKRPVIRHIILCTISLMLLLSSCREYAEPSDGGKTADTGYPDVLKITRCLYFGDASDNHDLKEEFTRAFAEKTGIRLEVICPPRDSYMEKVNLMIASGELDGMVNFFTPNNIMQAIADDTIEPLDEYLKDNEAWHQMPEEYRDIYRIEGKIYAIPAGYEGSFFTRSFRKDWLDNLGLSVPGTVDELFEVARAFTEDDPDGNGIDDTHGLTSSKLWNLQDIFQAFDAMLSNTGDISIVWDPVSGVWQDSMLKPEMADALAFIKKLYDNGYLDANFLENEGSNMRENLWNGKSGSAFYWVTHALRQAATKMKNSIPEAKWVEIPALKGKRTEQLNSRVMNGLIYTLVKGTKQPKETVNTFVDILLDRELSFMLRYGIEGKTYKRSGDSIVILTDPDTGEPYDGSGLSGEFPQFGRFVFPWSYDGSPEDMQASLNIIKIEKKILEEAIGEKLLFDVTKAAYDSPLSREFSKKSNDVRKIFEREISMAIFGEKSIEEALDDYRQKMRGFGATRILDEVNASIGKTSSQKY